MENNEVILRGRITYVEFSHETHGEKFFKGNIEIARMSGAFDNLPLIMNEEIFTHLFVPSPFVEIIGELRSYNQVVDGKRRLKLYVYIKEISELRCEDWQNTIKLNAFIVKQPNYRKTPMNRTICDLLVAVHRKTTKSDYIPCIVWGAQAEEASDFSVGDEVLIEGRIQSREYTKNDEKKVTYEVSVTTIDKKPEEVEI